MTLTFTVSENVRVSPRVPQPRYRRRLGRCAHRRGNHFWGIRLAHARSRRHDGADAPRAKPRGPVAGSPERKAILDAIARGEISVDDAIRQLTGE